jgi:hypothetical protein
MKVIKEVSKKGEHYGWRFFCPGCQENHVVRRTLWGFNGDYEKPTFTPSILITSGHYVQGQNGETCWCTYNKEHPEDPAPFKCSRCHSFIIDGRIQFLNDCTHELAGQTIDLPEIET